MQKCKKCLRSKKDDQFYKCSRKANGLQSYCKVCVSQYRKQHFQKHKEKFNTQAVERRKGKQGDKIRSREKRYRQSSLRTYLSHKFSQLKKEKHRGRTSPKYKLDISLEYLLELWQKQNGKCAIFYIYR